MKKRYYIAPGGLVPPVALDMEKQTHSLIAGATGAGKSTLINSFIVNQLKHRTPAETLYIFIDLKKVELTKYRTLPHCIAYADSPPGVIQTLNRAAALIDQRYTVLQRQGSTAWTGPAVWIIIDEYADITNLIKKETAPAISHILTLGRAAGVHCVIATQRPTNDVINPIIKANCSCKIALRCDSPQESRNIIQRPDAYALPLFGSMLYKTPAARDPIRYSFTPEDPRPLLEYWNSPKNYIIKQ